MTCNDDWAAMTDGRLTCEQLEAALEDLLDPVLSSRRTAEEPARALAELPRDQQDFVLHWTAVIQKSNSEMAYQFADIAPRGLATIGIAGARAWLLRAMDVYDREGLYPGSAELADVESFARAYRARSIAIELDEVRAMLDRFIRGLSGRDLEIKAFDAGETAHTDGEILFLPPRINRFESREENYRLYKASAVYLWAQTWYGTFRRPTADAPHLVEQLANYPDRNRAHRLFNRLEGVRLRACIARELPGLAREMAALDAAPPHDATWKKIVARLQAATATVADTLTATSQLYRLQMALPDAPAYQGGFDLDAVRAACEKRLAAEQARLKKELDAIRNAQGGQKADKADVPFELHGELHDESGELNERGDGLELTLDGDAVAISPTLANRLSSLLQDLDQIPPEWLAAGGEGEYEIGDFDGHGHDHDSGQGDAHDNAHDDVHFYDEWDFRRQNYRKQWCALRELPAHPIYDQFVDATLQKYLPQVAQIRRHFEALRGEDKLLKAQTDGDDIDLDAMVAASADARNGGEMSARLFTRKNKIDRDLAVLFMVDVSGSTKGWINEAVRESLVLLCEALETLGDRYALYAFSGMTRNRCETYRIKTFAEIYDTEVRARISGLRPRDYTRMGATIRHLSAILNRVDVRTRILITLSDGKPDDYDGYRGDYGIEDTRHALLEVRRTGIHPFCITIDSEGGDYLPHMYGHAGYAMVDQVRKLPLKVADIYRKLTT